jgi:serine phosphatase RsbU (regulator of sigma subunit)
MKKIFKLLLILLISTNCLSQDVTSIINRIGNHSVNNNHDSVLTLCNEALTIISNSNDTNSLRSKAEIFAYIADVNYLYGNIPKSLEYHYNGLKLSEEIGDFYGIATSLNDIGLIFDKQGDFENAMINYEKSLVLYKSLNDKQSVAILLNNIGKIYKEVKDFNKALEFYNEVVVINKDFNNLYNVGVAFNNIGEIYSLNGEYVKSLSYYNRSLDIYTKIDSKKGIASTLNKIGEVEIKLNNYNKAQKLLNQSYVIYNELKFPRELSIVAKNLYDVYKFQKNNSKALEFYEVYVTMRDSVNNIENQKSTYKAKIQYDFDKKESEIIAEQEKKDIIIAQEKKRESVIKYTVLFILLIVILFSSLLLNRFFVTKRQKTIIENQKHLVDEKQKEILDSIQYAKRIQTAILPPKRMIDEYLPNSFILYKPKDIVAGDFYWMEKIEDSIIFAAADCTGHGVPGAMVSVICNNGLNKSVKEHKLTEPGIILDKAKELIVSEFEKSDDDVKDGMDISMCSISGYDLKWAGANNPLWIIRNNDIIEYKADKQPIGKCDINKPFKTHNITLQKGDSIYIFTDGFVDQFGGEKGKKLKSTGFKKLLLSIQDKTMKEQSEILNNMFENWKGSLDQTDDVCVIGVKI